MRAGWLLTFLPDEVLPLLFVVGTVAVIVGFLAPRTLLGFVGIFVLFSMLSPFIEEFIGGLSLWWQLIILGFFCLAILRGVFGLLLGQRAADTMVGNLAADLVRLVVAMLILPVRVVRWASRSMSNGNGLR